MYVFVMESHCVFYEVGNAYLNLTTLCMPLNPTLLCMLHVQPSTSITMLLYSYSLRIICELE
jgi:hypothetical protein